MSSKAEEFLREELLQCKSKLKSLENDIQSIEIEVDTIDKNIRKIKKTSDYTGDILHSVNFSSEHDDKINALSVSKQQLLLSKEALELQVNEVKAKIVLIENVFMEDNDFMNSNQKEESPENVSHETDKNTFILMNELDRERISRDIHDTVIQNMTALIHKQEFVNQLLDKDINRCKLEISNTITVLKETIDELRNIIFDLRPMALDDLGIKAAIMDLITNIAEDNNNIIVTSKIIVNNNDIDQTISISILRTLRELLSNSVKHSGCNKVNIEVTIGDLIEIKFMDNGCGFDFEQNYFNKESKTGFGIQILKERIKLLKGTIEYNNNSGSNYIIRIPIY